MILLNLTESICLTLEEHCHKKKDNQNLILKAELGAAESANARLQLQIYRQVAEKFK